MMDGHQSLRHQRARGGARLHLSLGEKGTRLADLQQLSPLRLLFPQPEPTEWLTAAMVNTAGGLAGGDALNLQVALDAGTQATISAAAAEKIYRSLGAETEIDVRLEVGEGAALEWIPQETILFEGARLRRRFSARLAPGARLIMAETMIFGRAAHGERLTTGSLHDHWRIEGDSGLLWAEGVRLEGDLVAALGNPFGYAGAGAAATLLYVGADAEAHRDLLQAPFEGSSVRCGATIPRPGLLVARFLGDPLALRGSLSAALSALRHAAFGLPRHLPRLWAT